MEQLKAFLKRKNIEISASRYGISALGAMALSLIHISPNQFAADAYDCVYAYKQALEAAGATPDMSAEELCNLMIQQFTSMTFNGLTGENMTWDATGAVSKSPKGMVIENGAYVGLD